MGASLREQWTLQNTRKMESFKPLWTLCKRAVDKDSKEMSDVGFSFIKLCAHRRTDQKILLWWGLFLPLTSRKKVLHNFETDSWIMISFMILSKILLILKQTRIPDDAWPNYTITLALNPFNCFKNGAQAETSCRICMSRAISGFRHRSRNWRDTFSKLRKCDWALCLLTAGTVTGM